MASFEDLTGKQFSRLTVVCRKFSTDTSPQWLCRCECGNECIARAGDLRSGRHQSCGCLHLEKITKHGHSPLDYRKRSRTYQTWISMIQRCTNENATGFQHYGGRGISVCERWRTFENFLADMGERPQATSLDRFPNLNGNYEPGNCRWATRQEQNNNRRDCRMIEHKGETKSLTEWCKILGKSPKLIGSRLDCGLSFEEAIAMKLRAKIKDRGPSPKRIDISGLRFGIISVLSYAGLAGGKTMWNCRCDCGKTFVTRGPDMRKGKTKSCGCNRGKPGMPHFKN